LPVIQENISTEHCLTFHWELFLWISLFLYPACCYFQPCPFPGWVYIGLLCKIGESWGYNSHKITLPHYYANLQLIITMPAALTTSVINRNLHKLPRKINSLCFNGYRAKLDIYTG